MTEQDGWFGGKLADTFGVRVADEATQAGGFDPGTRRRPAPGPASQTRH